jgi:hypothetical protein
MSVKSVVNEVRLSTYHKNERQGDSALGGSELAYVAEPGYPTQRGKGNRGAYVAESGSPTQHGKGDRGAYVA